MPVPTPHLKSSAKQALDQYLAKVVHDRKVPATTLGVTNKDGELWFGCGGERVFGQPDEGQISPDTSEYPALLMILSVTSSLMVRSPPAILDDQVHHECESDRSIFKIVPQLISTGGLLATCRQGLAVYG
jgi:hypothetical protein